MKLFYKYMTIFFTFPPTSNHLHPLQVENCGSNLRLVVDEDDNGKFRLERIKRQVIKFQVLTYIKLCFAHAIHSFMGLKTIQVFHIGRQSFFYKLPAPSDET